jgi:membrane protein
MSDSPGRLRIAATVAKRAVARAREDRITTTAQALAYSLFLAIPSALLVALGIFSLVATPADVGRLIDRASGVIPPEAVTLLTESLKRTTASGNGILMTVVGLVLAIWTTTSAATTLMEGVTTAFGRRDERTFFRKRLLALVIVLCMLGSAVIVAFFLILGPYVERWIGNTVGQPGVTSWVWWTAQWPVLVLALLAAFAVMLYLGPDAEQRSWKLVTPGALTAVVIWLVASAGFSFYASRFGSYDKTWGSVAAVVIMLVWLWLTSVALLLGAEINAEAQRAAESSRRQAGVAPSARSRPTTRGRAADVS